MDMDFILTVQILNLKNNITHTAYKEIIAEAMKSDAQKTYERNSQPVIEEKNRAIGKTYMSNFLLRKALSMANTAVSSDEVASNE